MVKNLVLLFLLKVKQAQVALIDMLAGATLTRKMDLLLYKRSLIKCKRKTINLKIHPPLSGFPESQTHFWGQSPLGEFGKPGLPGTGTGQRTAPGPWSLPAEGAVAPQSRTRS